MLTDNRSGAFRFPRYLTNATVNVRSRLRMTFRGYSSHRLQMRVSEIPGHRFPIRGQGFQECRDRGIPLNRGPLQEVGFGAPFMQCSLSSLI